MIIRPSETLELIWIGWLISWVAASGWIAAAHARGKGALPREVKRRLSRAQRKPAVRSVPA